MYVAGLGGSGPGWANPGLCSSAADSRRLTSHSVAPLGLTIHSVARLWPGLRDWDH